MAEPAASLRQPAAPLRPEFEAELIEAERGITELLARSADDQPRRTEQLIELIVRAPARERFRAQFGRPLDPAAPAQLSEAQGDAIVAVVLSALEELGLDPTQIVRARELIAAGFRAEVPPRDFAPLVASLRADERSSLRAALDAEDARSPGRQPLGSPR